MPEAPVATAGEDEVAVAEEPQAEEIVTCEELEEWAHEELEPIDRGLAGWSGSTADEVRTSWREMTAPLRECVDAGEGAWMFSPNTARIHDQQRRVGPEDEIEDPTLSVWLTLVFVPGEERSPSVERDDEVRLQRVYGGLHSGWVSVRSTADLDGDGIGELAFALDRSDGYSPAEYFVFTFADGAIVDYPPAREIPIDQLVDPDEDGRVDIINYTRFWPCRRVGYEGEMVDGGCPTVLFHSAGPGYTPSDDVAAAYLRTQCPERPTRLVDQPDPQDCVLERDLQRIACARLWGASAGDVLDAVRDEYRSLPQECRHDGVLERLLAHARVEPPLTLE